MGKVKYFNFDDSKLLSELCLLDDEFLTACFDDDIKSTQMVLRIILEDPDMIVLSVHTQVFLANVNKRAVRLDILAIGGDGKLYNIEIQRDDSGAVRQRARFNSSMLDAKTLNKGKKFTELPETYVIFITENDIFKKGWPVYVIERCFTKTGEPFGDGSHIIYVNGACRNEDTPLGRLMHDFVCTNASDMHYKVLADRVRFFKENEKGVAVMSRMLEDMRNAAFNEGERMGVKKGERMGMEKGEKIGMEKGEKKGKKKALKSSAVRMLKAGKYTLDEIAEMLSLSIEEVTKLKIAQGV